MPRISKSGKEPKSATAKITCGIYLYSTQQKKILICHATHSPWNLWSIPKGLKDTGEDPFVNAARELLEETGIDLTKISVKKIDTLPPVKYQKQNKILESFLVITNSDLSKHVLHCHSLVNDQFPEVDQWMWIDPEKIKEKLHESQSKNYDLILELIRTFRE